MEYTTHYSSIEKVVYKFSESDIERALVETFKINVANKKVCFEMVDINNGNNSEAVLTLVYETVKKEK